MSLTFRLAIVAATAAALLVTACGGAAAPSGTASPGTRTASPSPAPAASPFPYQPLYPFASLAAAQAWEASYAAGGHQPWHLDAGLTALAFTQGYLGFTGISKIAAKTVSGGDAHITVGYTTPDGTIGRAAIIHLVTYGSGRTAPWEVVGTDDTTLTLDVPAYGTTVTSPARLAGTITGVDENLSAEVRQLGSAMTAGSYCCLPAGGQASPWSFTVPFRAGTGQVITIVVHTGGHVSTVERFAVTGARAG